MLKKMTDPKREIASLITKARMLIDLCYPATNPENDSSIPDFRNQTLQRLEQLEKASSFNDTDIEQLHTLIEKMIAIAQAKDTTDPSEQVTAPRGIAAPKLEFNIGRDVQLAESAKQSITVQVNFIEPSQWDRSVSPASNLLSGLALPAASSANLYYQPAKSNGTEEKISAFQLHYPSQGVFRREIVFNLLKSKLSLPSGKGNALVVITGITGSGKSEAAKDYAQWWQKQQIQANKNSVNYWLSAQDYTTLISDYENLAVQLGFSKTYSTNYFSFPKEQRQKTLNAELSNYVKAKLAKSPGWLLIFDGADQLTYRQMTEFFADHGEGLQGQVIITTQNHHFHVDPAVMLDITAPETLLTDDEAWQILATSNIDDKKNGLALADKLGRLPLALMVAADYIRNVNEKLNSSENFISYSVKLDSEIAYLQLDAQQTYYQQQLAENSGDTRGLTQEAALTLSLKRLSNAALLLMNFCAYLNRQQIPHWLLKCYFKAVIFPKYPSPLGEDGTLGQLMDELQRYSLLYHDTRPTKLAIPKEKHFYVHHQAQWVTRRFCKAWLEATAKQDQQDPSAYYGQHLQQIVLVLDQLMEEQNKNKTAPSNQQLALLAYHAPTLLQQVKTDIASLPDQKDPPWLLKAEYDLYCLEFTLIEKIQADATWQPHDVEEAIQYCDDLLTRQPSNTNILIKKADLLTILKRDKEALALTETALRYDITCREARLRRVGLLLKQHANNAIGFLYTFPPRTMEEAYYQGELRSCAFDFDGALAAYEQGLKFKLDDTAIRFGHTLALYKLNRHEEALQAINSLITNQPTTEFYQAQALIFMALRRYPEAIQSYSAALNLHPQNVLLLRERALLNLRLKRKDEALKDAVLAHAMEPANLPLLKVQAYLFIQIGQAEKAIPILEQLPDKREDSYENATLGLAYTLIGDHAKALAYYRKAADSNNVTAQYCLGMAYEQGLGMTRDLSVATQWYQKAAAGGHLLAAYQLGLVYSRKYTPLYDAKSSTQWFKEAYRLYEVEAGANDDAEIQYKLGQMCEYGLGTEQNLSKAIAWYQLAAIQEHVNAENCLGLKLLDKKDPQAASWIEKAANQGLAQAQNNLATCYARGEGGVEKNEAKAIHWYQKSAQNNNNAARFSLAWRYEQGSDLMPKDLHQAKELYECIIRSCNKILTNNPDDIGALKDKAKAYYGLKHYEKALTSYDEVLKIEPKDVMALFYTGNVYYDQRQYETALVWYDKVLAADAQYAPALNNKGDVYYDQQQYETALVWYDKALAVDDKYTTALCNIGNVYYDQKQYETALVWYDKTLAIEPRHLIALYNRGTAAWMLNDLENAIKYLQKVTELMPDFLEVYHNLACSYHIQGKPKEAEACFKKGLALNTAEIYCEYGKFVYQQGPGRWAEAVKLLESAIKLADKESTLVYSSLEIPTMQDAYLENEIKHSGALVVATSLLACYTLVKGYHELNQLELRQYYLEKFVDMVKLQDTEFGYRWLAYVCDYIGMKAEATKYSLIAKQKLKPSQNNTTENHNTTANNKSSFWQLTSSSANASLEIAYQKQANETDNNNQSNQTDETEVVVLDVCSIL